MSETQERENSCLQRKSVTANYYQICFLVQAVGGCKCKSLKFLYKVKTFKNLLLYGCLTLLEF